jgi:hypothetical protein
VKCPYYCPTYSSLTLKFLFCVPFINHCCCFITILNYLSATSLVAWWSELLTTNPEVPSPTPGSAAGIFLCRKDPHSDHGLGSLYNLGLRPLLVLHAHIHIPSGQRNCALWAPQTKKSVTLLPQPEGGTMKSIWTGGGIGGK